MIKGRTNLLSEALMVVNVLEKVSEKIQFSCFKKKKIGDLVFFYFHYNISLQGSPGRPGQDGSPGAPGERVSFSYSIFGKGALYCKTLQNDRTIQTAEELFFFFLCLCTHNLLVNSGMLLFWSGPRPVFCCWS